MEPLADAGGFLLLRANLARSVEKKETGHHVILYEENCFIPASNEPSRRACTHIWRMPRGSKTLLLAAGFLIDRISLTFHTIV